ncbi:MAG: RNA methyltransferase [Myxococcota bacterium]
MNHSNDLLANLRQESPDRIVIEGRIALERALAAGVPVACAAGLAPQLERLSWPEHTTLTAMSRDELDTLVGFSFHRGVVGALPRDHWQPSIPSNVGPMFLGVALFGLADPSNIGAIIRSAAAFGADAVFVDDGSADPFSRRSTRAAMAANFCIPVCVVERRSLIDALRARVCGLRVIAFSAEGDTEVQTVTSSRPELLVFGHEGSGLPTEILERSDLRVQIPTPGSIGSLNVAMTAAIALYQLASKPPLTGAKV